MRTEVLNGGFVELVRSMGGDETVVEAARVTSGTLTQEGKQPARGLIRYLMRHDHGTPFEFCQLEFHVKCPIYVQRQWRTHRIGSFNELSARYAEVTEGCEEQGPEHGKPWRGQAAKNRQGSEGSIEYERNSYGLIHGDPEHPLNDEPPLHVGASAESVAIHEYESRIEEGVAREQARTCLPLSSWTEFRWSVNLRSLLHFLELRTSSHAQEEIRAYANAIVPMVREVAPECVAAWEDYVRGAIKLSRLDLIAIKYVDENKLNLRMEGAAEVLAQEVGMSRGEVVEHMEKLRRLATAVPPVGSADPDRELRELFNMVKDKREYGHGESRGFFEDYAPAGTSTPLADLRSRIERRLGGGS